MAATATLEQSMGALTHGQEIRMLRVQLRHDLGACKNKRESLKMAARFVENPPPWVENMTVGDILLSCKAVGRSIVIKYCDDVGVSPLRNIGELTDTRRTLLVYAMRRTAEDYRR